jgi:hypothetical protein
MKYRNALERGALHEAAHVLAARLAGVRVSRATLTREEGQTALEGFDAAPLVERVGIGLAGALAEELAGYGTEAADDDLRRVVRLLLDECASNADALRVAECAAARVELRLRAHWGAVEKAAGWLQRCTTLDADALAVAVESALLSPLVCDFVRLRRLASVAAEVGGFAPSRELVYLARAAARAEHAEELRAFGEWLERWEADLKPVPVLRRPASIDTASARPPLRRPLHRMVARGAA